jgi:quercetin dioxygenase-like cupin family protein/DNA-binding XRE family transcriptional regulator
MDDRTAVLAGLIGARVRRERMSRSRTLDELADAAGVSRRALVNVEQGAVNPSVGVLLRLSESLGIALSSLVDLPSPAAATVTRAGEGAVLWSGPSGGRGVLVAATAPPMVGELWDWTLQPGERHGSEPHVPGTQELLQVLEGSVRLEIDQRTEVLVEGDAIAFPGDVVHAYANAGDVVARFSLSVVEPPGGARTERGARRPGPRGAGRLGLGEVGA